MTEQTNDFKLDVRIYDNLRIGEIVYHSTKHKYGGYDQMAVGYVSLMGDDDENWNEFVRQISARSVLPDDIAVLRQAYDAAKRKIRHEIYTLAGGEENFMKSRRI